MSVIFALNCALFVVAVAQAVWTFVHIHSAEQLLRRINRERAEAQINALQDLLGSMSYRSTTEDYVSAKQRARELLRETVTAAEYKQYTECGYLEVQSPRLPLTSYRLVDHFDTIVVMRRKRATHRLCIQSGVDGVPWDDVIVSLYLQIKDDDRVVHRIGNRFGLRGDASER